MDRPHTSPIIPAAATSPSSRNRASDIRDLETAPAKPAPRRPGKRLCRNLFSNFTPKGLASQGPNPERAKPACHAEPITMNRSVFGHMQGIEMRARRMWACTILAIFSLLGCINALAGSKDLADSAKAIIEANESEDWPDRCQTLRADMLNTQPTSTPQRVEPITTDVNQANFKVVVWNGIRIPIPGIQFDKILLIPGGLSAIRSTDTGVMYSRLDLTPLFHDHFGGIEEFSAYVESGNNLVQWIEDGLALRANDLQCRAESMIDDMIRVVHSLFTQIAVLADEETVLMRLGGDHPAMVLGDVTQWEKPYRIQYIVQHPNSENIEMVTITYHLDQPPDLIHLMSAFASTIDNDDDWPESDLENIVGAILDRDHDRASSIARAMGLDVHTGLE